MRQRGIGLSAILAAVVVNAQDDPVPVNPACFKKVDAFAGYETGREFSDMELLTSTMMTDMRMGYFYVCQDSEDQTLTDFKLLMTANFGEDASEDLDRPDGCRWVNITDASTR